MKIIAITIAVDDDTDIMHVHERILEEYPRLDEDHVIVYESVDALIHDHLDPVLPASLRVD